MANDKVTATTLMPQITIPLYKEAIKHIAVGLDEPLCFWGGAGNGKTEGAAQVCEEEDYEPCDIRLGQQDTIDLRGFPGVDQVKGSPTYGQTIWYTPSMLPFIGNDQWSDTKTILLTFDEFNQGAPQVLGNAYQIVQERRMGEHILKPNVRIICICNRETDRGIANRVPLPLCNRLTHYELVVDVQAFCEHAMKKGIPRWLIAFWLFRQELVNTFDPDKPEKIFATPRTWFKFAKYIAADITDDLRIPSCMGAVGRGPALEALGYRDIYEKVPSVKDIIKDPMGTPVPREASMEYAVCVKVAGEMGSKNVKPLYKYLQRMKPEFTVLSWTLAGKRDASLMTTAEFIDFGQKYRDAFSAQN
jgi:hypothetical protein